VQVPGPRAREEIRTRIQRQRTTVDLVVLGGQEEEEGHRVDLWFLQMRRGLAVMSMEEVVAPIPDTTIDLLDCHLDHEQEGKARVYPVALARGDSRFSLLCVWFVGVFDLSVHSALAVLASRYIADKVVT